jgi:hypothetical protein
VGFKGRDVMKKVLGVKLGTVMECCGHNGTYAMTVESFEPSQRVGKRAFDGMIEGGAGEERDVGDGLPARGAAVRAARGQKAHAPDVDSGEGVSRGELRRREALGGAA